MKYLQISYSQLKIEVLSGITVAISLIPEALSFALLVGVAPSSGLWAAFFMAISTALFGGRPGIISGATGATAVILASFVTLYGEEHLYLAVFVAGLIQFLIWLTNGWKLFKFIPKIVISGFLISLAILILMSQFRYLSIGNLSILQKIIMISIVVISSISMYFSNKRFKFPSALSAIIIGSLLSSLFSLPTIKDLSIISNNIPHLVFPEISINLILLVLPYSIGMALSGLTESLITVDSVCDKLGKSKGSDPKSKETFAQSIGNLISGLFTSIGGCVLVGQTNLNIAAGAKSRISSIVASLSLLSIILIFGKYIQHIPLAGLIGVMLIVSYETGDWTKLKDNNIVNRITLIITIICSLISHNLAIGVIVGSISYYILKKYQHNKEQLY